MIKKTHKIRHNRRLNKLWSEILFNRDCERLKDYDMVFDNGRVLFVKKGENK